MQTFQVKQIFNFRYSRWDTEPIVEYKFKKNIVQCDTAAVILKKFYALTGHNGSPHNENSLLIQPSIEWQNANTFLVQSLYRIDSMFAVERFIMENYPSLKVIKMLVIPCCVFLTYYSTTWPN